jgi:hypothetical protein
MQDISLETMLMQLRQLQLVLKERQTPELLNVEAELEVAITKRRDEIVKALTRFKGPVFRFRKVIPIEPDYVMVWPDGTIDVGNDFLEHYIRVSLSMFALEEPRIHTFLDDDE